MVLGFIGSNLIKLLLSNKFNVINIDKVTYSSNFYNTKEFNDHKNYKFIKCDINDKLKLGKIIYKFKPAGIFNLAAETMLTDQLMVLSLFINSNIIGVFNLLEIFRKYSKINKKTKLIHISTDEVYGSLGKEDLMKIIPTNQAHLMLLVKLIRPPGILLC